jgi:hypothetical protein
LQTRFKAFFQKEMLLVLEKTSLSISFTLLIGME